MLAIAVLARYVTPQIASWSRLVLKGNEQVGYIAGDSASQLPSKGVKGIAGTTLRPAGKVIIDDVWYDAISTGNFIEKGESIIVADLDGSNVMVEKSS